MKREDILAGIDRLQPWFHCIDLGNGILTRHQAVGNEPIDHPKSTWEKIKRRLPSDLSGKSVLDVGCNAGFYSVRAKRRGAARVLGVDAQRLSIRQAVFVQHVLGLDIEYRRMSAYDLSPGDVGQFDVTLALGLLYHCKHLVQALERLAAVTKELLIIETAIFTRRRSLRFLHRVLQLIKPSRWEGRPLHLLAYVENAPDAKESIFNWFLPSLDFLRLQLMSLGFEKIDVNVDRGRAILVCRKMQAYPDSRMLGHLAATINLEHGAARCGPGSQLLFRVSAENIGWTRWLAGCEADTGKGVVRLGAHLLREDGEDVIWDYGRSSLSQDVAPGEFAHFEMSVLAPEQPGRYVVEFDLVSEQLAWFEDLGSITHRHGIQVVS